MKMKTNLYVVCKYERWSVYWYKELLNYILAKDSSSVVSSYNSRDRKLILNGKKSQFVVEFVNQSKVDRSGNQIFDGVDNCRIIDWNDTSIEKLYSKVKGVIDND